MLYPPLYHKHTHMCSHTISLRLITCPEEGSRAWQSLFLPLRQHTRAPHYNLPLHQQMLQHLENNGRGCFIFQHPNRNCVDFGVQIGLLRKNNKNIVFHDTKNPRFKCFHIEFFQLFHFFQLFSFFFFSFFFVIKSCLSRHGNAEQIQEEPPYLGANRLLERLPMSKESESWSRCWPCSQ